MRKSSSSRVRFRTMRFSFWSKKPSSSLSRSRSRASCSSSVMKWYSWRVTFCRKISSLLLRLRATLRTSDTIARSSVRRVLAPPRRTHGWHIEEPHHIGPFPGRHVFPPTPGGGPSAPAAAPSPPGGRAPGGWTVPPSASVLLPAPAGRTRRPGRTRGRTARSPSGRGPLQHVDQGEIDLALLELDRGHLHLHAVAQAIDVSR